MLAMMCGTADTTPTDEEFYNSLSPDLKRKVDEHRAQQAKLKAAGLPNNKVSRRLAGRSSRAIVHGADQGWLACRVRMS